MTGQADLIGMADITAIRDDDTVEVVLQHEFANPGRAKLYIHYNGATILRICKLRLENVRMVNETQREER